MKDVAAWAPESLPTSWSPSHGWLLSYLLPVVGIGATLGYVLLQRSAAAAKCSPKLERRGKRALTAVLALAALLSVFNYTDYGVYRYGTYINEWDVFHYYLGAKYARELGYFELYRAALVADQRTGLKYQPATRVIRDLSNVERLESMDAVLARGDRYERLFAPARWQEFVADVAWFKAQLPEKRWSELFQDYGYNGTPAWSLLVGSALNAGLSIRSAAARDLILALDPLLFFAAFSCIAWAFGLRTMLLAVIFVGTHYLLSWGHLKGALLRTDFAVCVALAVCLVKKGWYKSSGVLLGWSILARVFPVFFLVGPGVRLLAIWLSERRLDRRLFGLCLSCATGVGVVTLGSLIYFHGDAIWHEWFQKITTHYLAMSHWNIGYQPLVDVEFVDGVPELIQVRARLAEEPTLLALHLVTTWGVRALVLVPGAYFIRYMRDHEALAYSFVFVFFMVAATYYYYLILIVPLLFFASRLEEPACAAGVALMFLTGVAGYVFFSGWDPLREQLAIFHGWKQYFQTYYYESWMICATALLMVAIGATRGRALERGSLRFTSRPPGR